MVRTYAHFDVQPRRQTSAIIFGLAVAAAPGSRRRVGKGSCPSFVHLLDRIRWMASDSAD